MNNIFITGSSGFLGTKLVLELEKAGKTFVATNSKNCNLLNRSSLDAFDEFRADYIIHLAAWTQAGDFCLHNAGNQWIINQTINTNIIDWWVNKQSQAKFISMGTSCSYDPTLPHIETNYLDGLPIDLLFTYGMTKRMLHIGQRAVGEQFGLKHLTFVPSTLYGPGYPTSGKQLHFIFDLIRKILRGKHYGTDVVLWGDGYQKRELIFIDDFLAVLLELAPTLEDDLVNVGGGHELSIRTFAAEICNIVGYPAEKILYDEDRYVGAKSKTLCISKLRELYPNFKSTSLNDGLQQTIRWCLDNKLHERSS